MLKDWVWVAWHLKGGAGRPADWFALSAFERSVIIDELNRRIDEHNDALTDH